MPMSQTAEGIRKVGVVSRLLRNRRLDPARGGCLFMDEPEAHLHPRAQVLLADLLHGLARAGIQVYVATHSYFIVKRLEQRAREDDADHVLVDLRVSSGPGAPVTLRSSLLRDGLPEGNPILRASLALLERDVELDLGS